MEFYVFLHPYISGTGRWMEPVSELQKSQGSVFHAWIENYLETQFDFVCVDNLSEFEQFHEMAITQNGLIKFKRGKHEKDDRPHITQRENFMLVS